MFILKKKSLSVGKWGHGGSCGLQYLKNPTKPKQFQRTVVSLSSSIFRTEFKAIALNFHISWLCPVTGNFVKV